MKEIWIATTNKHKVQEFKRMFEKEGIQVFSMLDLEEKIDIVENGTTFEENACIKAETLSRYLNRAVIADDSGLEVDAMNKEPGIHSARWLGHDTDYSIKNQEIIRRLENAEDRTCRFICAIALARVDYPTQVFKGVIEGVVANEISGTNGFGYDPIFMVPSLNKKLSEISEEEKNRISHRGQACKKLMEYIHEEI